MAIIKVAIPAPVPSAISEYQAQNAHLSAFINQVNSQAFILTEVASTTVPALKQGAYINHAGVLYVVDSGDEAISGSPSDGNVYIKLSVSGVTLVASFVNDISGYAWNPAYGYLASGTDLILPYLLVKASAAYAKYRMDITNPIRHMDQDLRTTDSPEFASLLVKDNYVVAGDTHFYGQGTRVNASSPVGTAVFDKSITCPCIGSFRCSATICSTYNSASFNGMMSMVVYKNGVEIYRYDQTTTSATLVETKTYDAAFVQNDIIRMRIYLRSIGGSGSSPTPYGEDMYFNADHTRNLANLYDSLYAIA